MHQEVFSGQIEGELLVSLPVHGPYVLEQRDDIHPFEIVCRRMSKQGFKRPQVRAV
jgi:hypothetical protein